MTTLLSAPRFLRWVLATALLLLVPLVAMQFTSEVRWTLTDFVVAGVLLSGTGFAYELIASRVASNVSHRLAASLAVAGALLLVWINLAVGIIGTEDNPANLMYLGVLAVEVIGAMIAGFQPRGMARAMFATALAQALVAVIAVVAGLTPIADSTRILILECCFVGLWVGSALLFQRASDMHRRA